jgi:hypothetical protein
MQELRTKHILVKIMGKTQVASTKKNQEQLSLNQSFLAPIWSTLLHLFQFNIIIIKLTQLSIKEALMIAKYL